MAEAQTDSELLEGVKQRDQKSFEELVNRYTNKVYSLAARMTRNREDAEEVLQDVFVTVYRKIHNFEGKSSFSSWLYRVTVNAALMRVRKNRQAPAASLEEALPQINSAIVTRSADRAEGEQATLRNELLTALVVAINKLPDDYRPVFVLRDIDGLTSKEVGDILDLSVPAVKSRLHRSRLLLRRRLQPIFREYMGDLARRAAND